MADPIASEPPSGAARAAEPGRWRLVESGPDAVLERDGGYTWRIGAAGSGRIAAVLEGPRDRGTRVEARPRAFLRAHPELAGVPGLPEALERIATGAALETAA
jgi:hypothetical protein